MDFLKKKAPNSIQKIQLRSLTNKIVACDASIAIHQFLNAKSPQDGLYTLRQLQDKEGNCTGHLVGFLHRTLKFLENRIRPIWVFDGRSPELKRLRKMDKYEVESEQETDEELEEIGAMDILNLLHESRRSRPIITRKMIDDSKTMLKLIGVPVVQAPSEAEAQCAVLVKSGLACATITEDMDALAFGSNFVWRGVNQRNNFIQQISLTEILKELELTYEEFVDFCILCGCDYTQHIGGVGPSRAFKLIKEHRNIESLLEFNDHHCKKRKNLSVPVHFSYQEARELFRNPNIRSDLRGIELDRIEPDEEGLLKFLVEERNFTKHRVETAISRIKTYNQDFRGFQNFSLKEAESESKGVVII